MLLIIKFTNPLLSYKHSLQDKEYEIGFTRNRSRKKQTNKHEARC